MPNNDDSSSDAPAPPPTGAPKDPREALPPPALTELPEADGALTNLTSIVRSIGLAPYHQRGARGQRITIAVLDNGFTGLSGSIGKRLPPDTMLVAAPLNQLLDTSHGLKMAEIAYAVATGSTSYRGDQPGPRILLLNANGFTNFTAAIDKAILEKVDIVLYAQVWEYGGNLDGKGFINKEVNRATAAGITWINAAGNLGLSTASAPVPTGAKAAEAIRFSVPQDRTPVKIVVAWNDFTDSKDYRTSQDLDAFLEDDKGQKVAAGELIQDGGDPARGAKYSAHAREIIKAVLPVGTYRVRVVKKSQNFKADAAFRVTIDGLGARLVDGQRSDESVLIPADNPGVVTIGASDAQDSGRLFSADGRRLKPDLLVPSEVAFTSGTVHHGTSAASAIAAGALASFATVYGRVTRNAVTTLTEQGVIATEGATTPQLRLEDPSTILD